MAASETSQSATMFSEPTPWRLDPPRPPTPITAMFSFSLRLRPRTIAGAANAPAAAPATARPNCRRVGRAEAALEVSLMSGPSRLIRRWSHLGARSHASLVS